MGEEAAMVENEISDADISRGCRQNDPQAWRQLIQNYTPLVYRIAYRMLKDTLAAEDVSQEVFMNVHRFITSHDPTRPLGPWLARITYNTSLKRLAKSTKVAQQEQAMDQNVMADNIQITPEYQVQHLQRSEIIVTALNRLPAQDRALVIMRYREGFSDTEIAEATRLPVGTVKTKLFRARKKLKRFLKPFFKEVTL
jgi:RNA polymerase sigma-70 factor (ECF subfamily)